MKMALQKFAHGAHQYGNFKRTALHVYENALHYDNKIPSTSTFYADFENNFFRYQKININLLSSDVLRLVR